MTIPSGAATDRLPGVMHRGQDIAHAGITADPVQERGGLRMSRPQSGGRWRRLRVGGP